MSALPLSVDAAQIFPQGLPTLQESARLQAQRREVMKDMLTIVFVILALAIFSVVMIAWLGPSIGGGALFLGFLFGLYSFLRDREKEQQKRRFWFGE